MSSPINVPSFPESVEEGTLTTWHKQEGDSVQRDEKVAEIETDKIVLDVTAPVGGQLIAVEVKEGDTVKPGSVLAQVEEGEGDSAAAPDQSAPANSANPADQPDAPEEPDRKAPAVPEEPSPDEPPLAPEPTPAADEPAAAPEPELPKSKPEPKPPATSQPESASEPPRTATELADSGKPRDLRRAEKRVPMTRIRARIAERLVEAQRTAAILTTFNEINMQPVMELRRRYQEPFQKAFGVKLGFMSFFVKAAAEALRRFPVVNATLDGSDIIYHGYYDIGVAVSTERGLVVPILQDADQLAFGDIEKKIIDFADRAQNGQLTMDELTGGTFTITNGGVFGSLLSTPILNPPQSAILGMHTIQERPVAENGKVVIRPQMYLALSYDHRLVDGREAVQFLVAIKEYLEEPARALLEV